MRNISLGLAALAIVLVGSLTSVAYASTEALHAAQPSTGIYDGADKFRDATGHPLSGWQNVTFSPNS
jgi:hypothetical protein